MKIFSKHIQMEVVKMIAGLGVGHLGGSLSITDLLSVLYCNQLKYDPKNPQWEDRDWVVMSKGHAGPALYATLALKGFMPMEELATLNRPHTNLPSHVDRTKTPGIDMTCGSLGQGASTAAGVALGMKMNGKDNRVYVVFGDGEIDEGQVWEMALFAGHRKLNNLIGFVDYNKLQLDGTTDKICALGDIGAKFAEFGWYAQTVDGHDVEAIDAAIENAKKQTDKPSMIVLNTIKGNGWSKSANQVGSHSRGLNEEELQEALAEMQAAIDSY
ncbi:MAG: transketolase [Agathobaculum sp.]|uniref:transketolase n=1 Tax=Agathobaculum sp. TaxID=2048138 RepID=UPI003D945484